MSHDTQSEAERRRHPRTQLQLTVSSILLDPEGDIIDSLETVDISRKGMGAISAMSYYPGQRMLICLPMSEQRGRRNIYARVVRCRQIEEGYHLGLQFECGTSGAWYGLADTAAAA